MTNMIPTNIGLRTYDTAIGFRNLGGPSAILADFSSTHIAGMAAILAGAIKGKEVIRDARALKRIAADVLRIDHWAFEDVVLELAELEMVRGIQRRGREIVSFAENIPLSYDNVHDRLGNHWLDKQPSELEEQFITILDKLAQTPVLERWLATDVNIDANANKTLRTIGEKSALIRYYALSDGTEIVTSPLHAFEHPEQLITLFERHNTERIQEAFSRVRMQPGFPVLMNNSYPVIEDMIRMGLIPAPTVIGSDARERAFAIMVYGLDPSYLTSKKQVLDRALALIACVRCGEVSGGATNIKAPDKLLAALINPDKNYTLAGHSSTPRQYAPLIRMGMITAEKIKDASYDKWGARLIPTADNLEAVNLACTLLKRKGDGVPERGNEKEAARLLFTEGKYFAPIETIALVGHKPPSLTTIEIETYWDNVQSGGLS